MEEYKKGHGAGSRGIQFQINLLIMILLNALESFRDWKLSTENKDASKFDDAVLELPDGAVLLQAKFKENKKVITLEHLLSTNSKNDDFSLGKYFLAYMEVETKFQVKNVIICTNASADNEVLEFLKRETVTSESILYCRDYFYYKFKDNILANLKSQIREYCNSNKLQRVKDIVRYGIPEKTVKQFLEKLQLYFNYPAESELKEITEQSLSKLKNSDGLCRQVSFLELFDKVKNWYEQRRGEYLTETRTRVIFCEIKNDKYCEKLQHYNVSFQQDVCIFDKPRKIFHIVTQNGHLLHVIKIYQALQQYKTKILFVNPEEDIIVQKQIIESFKLPLYIFLIIACRETSEEVAIRETFKKLKGTLEKHTYKKVIVVAKKDIALLQQLKLSVETIEDYVIFENFLQTTQRKLLNKKNIIFQGTKISLTELLSDQNEDYKGIINLEVLEKIVKDERIKVGSVLQPLSDNISNGNYVHRTFKRRNKEFCATEIISEENIYFKKEKSVLITDTAGMGKTTVLKSLATTIKQKFPKLWIIRVQLKECADILKEFNEQNRKSITINELLNSNEETKLRSNFEQDVFSMKDKVVLLLDGVDEINPDYTDLILNLLVTCQKSSNFAKIFVTARPHMSQKLEKHSNATPFVLIPFTWRDQIEYLTKYWMHNLNLGTDSMEKCEKYAVTLLTKLATGINTSKQMENQFAEIPLQARMLAEIFQENYHHDHSMIWIGCKEYLKNDAMELKLPEYMNMSILYQMFIMKKRDLFIGKENLNGHPDEQQVHIQKFSECLSYCRALALEKIFSKEQCNLFSSYQQAQKNLEPYMLKVGIVQKFDETLHFIHRTFAEYFVAESILKELQFCNKNTKFHNFLIDNVFNMNQYNIIRMFLDGFIYNLKDTLDFTIFRNRSLTKLGFFKTWHSCYVIHILSSEGCVSLLKFILKCVDFRPITDKEVSIDDLQATTSLSKWTQLAFGEPLTFTRLLVQQGGINIRNSDGNTPLHFAASNDHFAMVQFLTEQGANVNSTNNNGETALFLTCNAELIKLLVNNGTEINLKNFRGHTALYSLVLRWIGIEQLFSFENQRTLDPNAIKTFILCSANINEPSYNSFTVLHYASSRNRYEHIEFLVQCGADVTVRSKRGLTALHFASYFDNVDVIKFLLRCGIDVNSRNEFDQSALHFAALNDSVDAIKILIERDADINIKDSDGRTPLHFASLKYAIQAIEILVKHGAYIDITDNNGHTSLHLASSFANLKTVKVLIHSGANVNIADSHGRTPLHFASGMNSTATVKFLAEHGANINAKDNSGLTAIDWADNLNLHEIIMTLKCFGVNVQSTDNKLFLEDLMDEIDGDDYVHFKKQIIDKLRNAPLRRAEIDIENLYRFN